jgi:hypothetical protein
MKKIYFILFIGLLFACTGNFKDKGSISVHNGEGKEVSIPFQISDYSEFSKKFTNEIFLQVVKRSSEEAKSRCKYELTYEPISIDVFSENDTITTLLSFSAKNGFGVPNKERGYCKFKGSTLIDSF